MMKTVDLPEELVADILSRVPAISLARFRAISKGWNALIKDGRFAKKHFVNAPRPSLFIIFNELYRIHLLNLDLNGMQLHDKVGSSTIVTSQFNLKDPLRNCSSDEAYIRDVFQCDSLLLCATKDERLVVWNPCSGETKWIQPRDSYKLGFYYYALGKSSCNKYKILKMCRYINNPLQTEYEVYDFASDSWGSVGNSRALLIPWSQRCGVSLKGSTYWLGKNHWSSHNYLLSFDFSTETFQRQSIPHSDLYVHVAVLSVVRDEKLCLLLLTHPDPYINSLDVWMATKSESTGVMSWSKFLTANPSCRFSDGMSFVADEQNKVAVCYDGTKPKNILHIVGEDRHIQVVHHGAKSSNSCLLSYVPTLIQIP